MTTKTKYEIQTLTPASGFSALWSIHHGGSIQIEMRPLEFVGVAQVQHFRNGKWIDDGTEVVGIELGEGCFQVIKDASNYHGIVRNEASWTECLDLLPSDVASRVVEPDQARKVELVNV